MVRLDSSYNNVAPPKQSREFDLSPVQERARWVATEHPIDEAFCNERKQFFVRFLSGPETTIPLKAVASTSSTPLLEIVGEYAVGREVTLTISSNCKFLQKEAFFASERRLVVNPNTDIVEAIYTFLYVDDREFCRVVAHDGTTDIPFVLLILFTPGTSPCTLCVAFIFSCQPRWIILTSVVAVASSFTAFRSITA